MTNQLFTRLTQPATAREPLDYTPIETYIYTPRKPLRRVLDHALDHLEQIEQWQRWRHDGTVPVPTDGWVPSTVTIAEDRVPLTAADLDAWLWRIDQAMRLLQERATALTREELDWQPPDAGWPLRRVLHHVARYVEADARFGKQLAVALEAAGDAAVVFPDPYGTFRTPADTAGEVLALEGELVRQA